MTPELIQATNGLGMVFMVAVLAVLAVVALLGEHRRRKSKEEK